MRERRVEAVDLRQAVIRLEAARRRVRDDQRLARLQHAGLLLLREARQDVAERVNDVRDDFSEMSSGGAPKTYAPARHVGHHQVQHLLAHRGLPLGAFHQRVIEPGDPQAPCGKQEEHGHDQPESRIVEIFFRMDLAHKRAEAGKKDQRNRDNKNPQRDHRAVNEISQETQLESAVFDARGSDNRLRIRGRHRQSSGNDLRIHGPRRRGSNGKSLSTG